MNKRKKQHGYLNTCLLSSFYNMAHILLYLVFNGLFKNVLNSGLNWGPHDFSLKALTIVFKQWNRIAYLVFGNCSYGEEEEKLCAYITFSCIMSASAPRFSVKCFKLRI